MFMKHFATFLTVGFILTACTTQALAVEDWFLAGPYADADFDVLAAPRIIVAERVANLFINIGDTGNARFPAGTYYGYRVWLHPDGGGKPFSVIGFFKSASGAHGMYDLTNDAVDLTVPPPPLVLVDPFDTVGFTSYKPNESP